MLDCTSTDNSLLPLVEVASQRHPLDIAECRSANMASGLIGISVAVTLQNPPNTVVHGTVAAVNSQTSTLTLQDGEPMECRGCMLFSD